ncbi:hypothetical protein FRB95_005027 [Tulasnella sp. JGI-2019a]|nr:hypothetical protein FRB95_005027 [Tulasnella sp. JGI-2019a]
MASNVQRPRFDRRSDSAENSDSSTIPTPSTTSPDSDSSSSSGSSSSSNSEGPTSSLLAMFNRPASGEDKCHPPTGGIHLHGEEIVSHHHNALDRFEQWQRANHARLRKLDTRQKWDIYISDPEINKATMSRSRVASPKEERATEPLISEVASPEK